MNFKLRIKPLLFTILKLYLVYALITGVLIFALPVTKSTAYQSNIDTQRFYGSAEGSDRVVLLDDPALAALARHDLIDNAEHTIDVAYYSLHRDHSAKALFGALIEAADRGVTVRILLDGMAHGMTGSLTAVRYAVMEHENMELKLYEPFDFLRPWTWNNRLHDKYIIADKRSGIIGGRNVGIRYFDPNSDRLVKDRDALIFNQSQTNSEDSVLYQLKDYFDYQWNHEYTQDATIPLRLMAQRLSSSGRAKTEQTIREVRKAADLYYDDLFDWESLAIPTRNITLIHNPVDRFNKEPWVLMELAALMRETEKQIVIQTPYVIPTYAMGRYLPDEPIPADIVLLTNHPAARANTNLLATAGYLNKKLIVENAVDHLYEYYSYASIHAKTFIFDQALSVVGSFNLDARSSFLSTESMVVIDSPEFTEILEESILDTIEEGLADPKLSPLRGIGIGMLRVVVLFLGFLL